MVTTLMIVVLSIFNPISYGLSDSVAPMWGASEAPPKISRRESSLTPCCYIAFVCLCINGSHAKIWTEVSKFERDFRISKFSEIEISRHIDKQKIAITHLILKIED